jgi:hypothetical protein
MDCDHWAYDVLEPALVSAAHDMEEDVLGQVDLGKAD